MWDGGALRCVEMAHHGPITRMRFALPPGAAGQWLRLRAVMPGGATWWARLELADLARGHVVREAFLGPARTRRGTTLRGTLLHVPWEAGALLLEFYGEAAGTPSVHAAVLGRVPAALLLLRHGVAALPAALAGHRSGRLGRLRVLLGQGPARRGEAPPYAAWRRWFATAPPPATDLPPVMVLGDTAEGAAALAATRVPGARVLVVAPDAPWPVPPGTRVVVLGPGEVLAEGALAWFAAADPAADLVYADTDTCAGPAAAPVFAAPVFKPGPGPALLRSGLLTTGACLVRWPDDAAALPRDAAAARLELALRPNARIARIPRILTHLAPGASSAAALMPVLAAHLRARGLRGEVAALNGHLRLRLALTGTAPRVSILVASSCRAPHVVPCLRRVAQTAPAAELLVAVSRIDPADRAQARVLRAVAAIPGVRVLRLDMPEFSYPAVNNHAAAAATGDILLLLNDDVAPFAPGWLEAMLAHFAEPDVGAVGARLLYGNGLVQHGGVIMGLGGLCEHADRLQRRDDPGPFGLSHIDHEVSAVTAACMAVRATLFRALDGLEPGFAIALNDVDFCLRLRATGVRIVQCAGAELVHFESLSLGRHYRGARAVLEAVEVRRLRARWAPVIADDPCYNPQAALLPGREWHPAFPPRIAGFSATLANSSAPD